jgi:putative flavoprotein involved in K+ transport
MDRQLTDGHDLDPVRVETVVIGAGQAGLAAGYHLARRGRDFVILDAGRRVGDNWRSHWDSLRLYSPARAASLPGMRFPAPPASYPTKDQMADFLETYAATFDLPVRTGVRVTRLARHDGEYLVTTDGPSFRCDNVVVASGTFGRTPYVPGFAGELDPGIRQLHSSTYKNPAQLRSGGVLVVGRPTRVATSPTKRAWPAIRPCSAAGSTARSPSTSRAGRLTWSGRSCTSWPCTC